MSGLGSVASRASAPGPAPHMVALPGGYASPQSGAWVTSVGTWPTANLAIYTALLWPWTALVKKCAIANWSAVSGNFDVGIYSSAGTQLWAAGSTAHAGTSVLQAVDVSPDLLLTPGLYFVGLVFDNTTASIFRNNSSAAAVSHLGIYTEAAAFPLPATASFAFDYSTAYQPVVYLSLGDAI